MTRDELWERLEDAAEIAHQERMKHWGKAGVYWNPVVATLYQTEVAALAGLAALLGPLELSDDSGQLAKPQPDQGPDVPSTSAEIDRAILLREAHQTVSGCGFWNDASVDERRRWLRVEREARRIFRARPTRMPTSPRHDAFFGKGPDGAG